MHLLRIAFFKDKMPDWTRHVLGVLGLAVPVSILFVHWQAWFELIALWSVILFGGGGLLLAFLVESWWEERVGRIRAEQIEQVALQKLKGAVHGQGE